MESDERGHWNQEDLGVGGGFAGDQEHLRHRPRVGNPGAGAQRAHAARYSQRPR